MDYKLFVEGMEYAAGKGSAGQNVVLTIGADANLKNGPVNFNLVCFLGTHESLDKVKAVYVGNDTPKAPADVELTEEKVTWNPVTTGEHGGYVDAAGMTYRVELNGKVIADNLKETSCPSGINPDDQLTAYSATVFATVNGYTSDGGKSDYVIAGQALEEPVSLSPTEGESLLFTTEDFSDSEWEWELDEDKQEWTYTCYQGWDDEADDWLYLPPVNIRNADYLHTFRMDAWSLGGEQFEVYMGKEPTADAMTTCLIESTATPKHEERASYEALFDAPGPGVYYIGVHVTGEWNEWFFCANNFRVDVSAVSKNGPDKVTDVVAEAGENGTLTATVKFNLPTTTIKGAALTGTVTAMVKSAFEEKTVSGEPGSAQTVTVETEQGDNKLIVTTSQGETCGMVHEVSVYTGVDVPGRPVNLKAQLNDDNLSGTLIWSAPTEGENGGYVRPEGNIYYLCQKLKTPAGNETWDIVEEIGLDVFEYDFSVAAGTPLRSLSLGIAAANEAGQSTLLASTEFVIGVPHKMPARETFAAAGGPNYGPVYLSIAGEQKVTWTIGNPADKGEPYAVSDNGAVIGTATAATSGCVRLPKFSTAGLNEAGFMPAFYIGGCDNIKVTAAAPGVEETVIMDLGTMTGMAGKTGYEQLTVKLPEAFQNKGWVEIKVYPAFTAEKSLFLMDGYSVKNLNANDLAVSVAGKNRGYVGKPMTLRATVTNIGMAESKYTGGKFTMLDGAGGVIAENTLTDNMKIAADDAIEVTWNFVPAVKDLGECTVRFELTDKDMDDTNNADEASCEIIKGNSIVVDDLNGAVDGDAVALKWSAAEVRNGLESFEDYVPFSADDKQLGEFTNVWDENISAYTLNGGAAAVAGVLDDVIYKAGFHVYNSEVMNEIFGRGVVPSLMDGEQLLIAFCPSTQADNTLPSANDWLITPLVKGGTEFSFSAAPIMNTYGLENIEICYTTEDTVDPTKFTVLQRVEVGNPDTSVPATWQDVKVTLPENARRVAIHYVSRDVFGVCIDNVNYIPEAGEVTVTGYEVYRAKSGESEFVKLGEVAECMYSDLTADMSGMNS